MQVLYGEGVATHTGPESCAGGRETVREALTGVRAGQPLSGVNSVRDADALEVAEGNTAVRINASARPDPASSETLARTSIFCTGTGRSPPLPAGAIRRAALGRREPKPMMHEEEKSDLPIVPVKPVNNAASTVAESVEGSGGTKRNAGQQSTDRTQCRKTVSQAQARIREAVSRNSKEKLTTLLHHVTVDALKSAFFNLKKRAAAGVDDVSWSDYAADLDRNLTDLHA